MVVRIRKSGTSAPQLIQSDLNAAGMAQPSPTDPAVPEREVMSATIDVSTLDLITPNVEGTAYVTIELEDSLLRSVTLWLDETRFDFSVVDPVLGTVEHCGGSIQHTSWPLPLVRTVLDRVGIGLLNFSS